MPVPLKTSSAPRRGSAATRPTRRSTLPRRFTWIGPGWRTALAMLAVVAALSLQPLAAQVKPEPTEFFEKKIRPVLVKNCHSCHNANLKTAGLDLTTDAGFFAEGENGSIIDRENPESSRLLQVIGYEERVKMPPTGKLKDEELADLTTWIKIGAPWPGAEHLEMTRKEEVSRAFTAEEKNFWAFQPIRDPRPPKIKKKKWIRSPIDRFILAKLEARSLKPAPRADKTALLRRATFDLTGLPPTEKEIADFLADKSPDAFQTVVERLLASPRYGERWGRHWLDVARYADSSGNDEDHRYPHSWRYRDYVIEALNQDLPYDQFVQEQIAGDLLPADKVGEVNRKGIIATGFLALGQKAVAQQDKKKMLYDIYDEQLDVTSKAFMSLTITCSRCHDHKFDPILTQDYYSLIGIFASTKNFADPHSHVSKFYFPPLVPTEEYNRYKDHREKIFKKAEEIDAIVEKQIDAYDQAHLPRLADYMLTARKVYHDGVPPGEAADENGLQEEVLKRWVAYLRPHAPARPHLEKWHQASAEELAPTAQAYQKQFHERAKKWKKELANWRKGVRERLRDRPSMPPPKKPEFTPEQDPFFHDVYLNRGPLTLSENEPEQVFSQASRLRLAKLREEFKHLEATSPPEPEQACGVAEGEVVRQKVFIRGDYNNLGKDAAKRFPLILAGFDQQPITQGSGRLELARWLTQPDHPLTARVMVNRIWHWHFGEGLVRTPNNFGKMGKRPTHPDLLDYLARRFIANGWSLKSMHRLIMLSNTYRMSSHSSREQEQFDPENKLFSRFPARRLDVEEIRDGLLAMDGSLDLTMGGTLAEFNTYTDSENSNDRLSMDPEKSNRRMVYLQLRRANLPPLLNMFDFGDATASLGKRPHTNVAPQALFMMNSRFVADRAQNLARALLSKEKLSDAGRLGKAYLRILNRGPKPEEIESGLSYIENFQKEYPDSIHILDGWQSFCRILMASNEFMYLD